MRAEVNVLMEKNKKTNVSRVRWYIKSKREVAGDFLCVCSYRNCSVSGTLYVHVVTQLTSLSHNTVSLLHSRSYEVDFCVE